MIKKLIIAGLLMLGFSTTFAQETITIKVDGELTEKQKAELQVIANQKIAEKSSPEKINEWVQVGPAIGKAISDTAKELGVVANDFVKTPVGQMTAFMIFYNYFGEDIITKIFGVIWLLCVIPVWIHFYNKMYFTKTISYYEKDKGPNGVSKVVKKDMRDNYDIPEYQIFLTFISIGIIVLIGVICIIK